MSQHRPRNLTHNIRTQIIFAIQWNINGFYSRLNFIQLLLSEVKPIALCLQETRLKPEQKPKVKNYTGYFKSRTIQTIASGGVAIFVKDEYKSAELPLQTNLEAIAVTIWYPSSITICNVYIPPDKKIDSIDIQNLIEQVPNPHIILGDFNAHSTTWGSPKTTRRGKILEETFLTTNSVLINTGLPTHFNSNNGSFSHIDLTLTDQKTAPLIEWDTMESLYDSDHFPIKINLLSLMKQNTNNSHKTWNLRRANWDNYQELITCELEKLKPIPNDINQAIKQFTDAITYSAEKAVGYTHPAQTRKIVPWWNEQCGEVVNNSKKAFNRYKKQRTIENLIEFKKLRAISRRTINQQKKQSWNEYVSSINSETPIQDVWNKIARIKGNTRKTKGIRIINTASGKHLTTDQEIADALAETLAKNSSDSNYTKQFLLYKNAQEAQPTQETQTNEKCHALNLPISLGELQKALQQCQNSSPGPDNIPYALLKNLTLSAKEHLLELYNTIWNNKHFPTIWQEAVVIPILKPNKDQTDTLSYRPISLTCTMCKLIEKIVNERLTWYLDLNNLLSNSQNGFRTNRSTIDNIMYLQDEILSAFSMRQQLSAVFFDLEKAYDTTWRWNIVNTLIDWGLHGNILQFIQNFLSNRHFQVLTNGILSSRQKLENGVPQGSVLSVTLFLVGVNDIMKQTQTPVTAAIYADDLVLMCRGKNPRSTTQILQKSIDQLHQWMLKTGFKFSASKTKVIHFCRNFSGPKPNNLQLNSQKLTEVDTINYLGLHFD